MFSLNPRKSFYSRHFTNEQTEMQKLNAFLKLGGLRQNPSSLGPIWVITMGRTESMKIMWEAKAILALTWEAEAKESQVRGQPGLNSKTVSQKKQGENFQIAISNNFILRLHKKTVKISEII